MVRQGYQPTHQPTRRRSSSSSSRRAIIALVVLCVVAAASITLISLLAPFPRNTDSAPADGADPVSTDSQQSFVRTDEDQRVTFLAVGDNLPEITLGQYADTAAGVPGDGLYDYTPIFAPIKPYVESADIAYINQETHIGGDDIGPHGYPSFNVTDSMADAVVDAGFDMVASATNHSYDWGENALNHSVALWSEKPVLFTGTARSEEEAAQIKTIEKNGITFSLLNYTYGVNGYEESDIPPYAINYMHEDRVTSDIAAARHISDVVIVAMHWGTENLTAADEVQQHYAQLIADAGADLVVGSHPHVIGPLQWVTGMSGNKTLVAYSLGNCLSNFEIPSTLNEIGGMLTCDFVKSDITDNSDSFDSTVSIENVSWIPIINHTEPGAYAIYALPDYTVDLAARHAILSSVENPLSWIAQTSQDIIGPDVTIAQ